MFGFSEVEQCLALSIINSEILGRYDETQMCMVGNFAE